MHYKVMGIRSEGDQMKPGQMLWKKRLLDLITKQGRC